MATDLVIVGGGLATARGGKAYREAGGGQPTRSFSADPATPSPRLVVATGAWPRQLPGGGRVFTLRTLAESTAIREAAKESARAACVGTGFIGLEVAASLRQL